MEEIRDTKKNQRLKVSTRLRYIALTLTATCLVGRVGVNALVGSELNSNNQGFLMHESESYPRLFKVARRISVNLMENYTVVSSW